MDAKSAGNRLFVVGLTRDEMGGSHFGLVRDAAGGSVPTVDPDLANRIFAAVHAAINAGAVRSCHDMSEGGLAVAAAEMAFAGGLGIRVDVSKVPHDMDAAADGSQLMTRLLFSESNTRFVCEVTPESVDAFVAHMNGVPHAEVGEVNDSGRVAFAAADGSSLIDATNETLKQAWQAPLDWK